MYGPLLLAASAGLALGGLVTWLVDMRYGRWSGLTIPGLAVLASAVAVWRGGGDEILALALASPVVLGSGLALLFRTWARSAGRKAAQDDPESR